MFTRHTRARRLRPLFSTLGSAALLLGFAAGCVSPTGDTTSDRQEAVRDMRDQLLDQLYLREPGARSVVENAAGYGAFTNANAHVIFLGGGSGYGVVVDNEDGRETFMRMAQGTVGLGLGVKEFRAVFVFEDTRTMDKFRLQGWDFGGSADAAAQNTDNGAAVTAASSVQQKIRIYQLTDQGIALTATAAGSRYWKDDSLN